MEKKRILFTGGTGFVGKNVIPILQNKFEIFAPTRHELNLFEYEQIETFLKKNRIDVIIHSANPNPVKNNEDESIDMFKGSMQIYMNLYKASNNVEKMLYIGSGAEFDKRFDISNETEEYFGKSIPVDDYGFAKYIMNELTRKSNNVYNLRLFACYGPYDFHTKFITHAIRCCLRKENLTIRQDCWFDYLHVYDLARVMEYLILHTPLFHDYNICSGKRIKLSQIASSVIAQMNSESKIQILNDGMNREYTADNSRLSNEMGDVETISLKDGIKMQIQWEKMVYEKESC